jgi:hypothetical protein
MSKMALMMKTKRNLIIKLVEMLRENWIRNKRCVLEIRAECQEHSLMMKSVESTLKMNWEEL